MKFRPLIAMLLACAACSAHRGWDAPMKQELLQRARQDQSLRDTVFGHFRNGGSGPDSALVFHLRAQDSVNGAWLEAALRTRGWPGDSAVGRDGAEAAFLLVQHARNDTAFQAAALRMIEDAYRRHDVDAQALALLTDEMLVDRGKPQRYGSKAELHDGRLTFDPIEDSSHVDERRASLGLMPLRNYAAFLDSLYGLVPHG